MESLPPADVLWSALLVAGVIAQLLERRPRRRTAPLSARDGVPDRSVHSDPAPGGTGARSLTHV